jgi:hypothetical protein
MINVFLGAAMFSYPTMQYLATKRRLLVIYTYVLKQPDVTATGHPVRQTQIDSPATANALTIHLPKVWRSQCECG